jgi:large subunit ribosomal protein L3
MIHALLGKKAQQTQAFLENGRRIPVTKIVVGENTVVAIKTQDKHGYTALQLGFGAKKHTNKAIAGHITGAQLKNAPAFLREIRLTNGENLPEIGAKLKAADVFTPGDSIAVTGTSKGKGFAGVVKRHNFRGGPRTHGQSDRERAPGSIGQTTTPGRVYRGKKMAGRMGHEQVTVRNLEVVAVTDDSVLVKGLVPGSINTFVYITKLGENKKFIGLLQREEQTEKAEVEEHVQPAAVESSSEPKEEQANEEVKIEEDTKEKEE